MGNSHGATAQGASELRAGKGPEANSKAWEQATLGPRSTRTQWNWSVICRGQKDDQRIADWLLQRGVSCWHAGITKLMMVRTLIVYFDSSIHEGSRPRNAQLLDISCYLAFI